MTTGQCTAMPSVALKVAGARAPPHVPHSTHTLRVPALCLGRTQDVAHTHTQVPKRHLGGLGLCLREDPSSVSPRGWGLTPGGSAPRAQGPQPGPGCPCHSGGSCPGCPLCGSVRSVTACWEVQQGPGGREKRWPWDTQGPATTCPGESLQVRAQQPSPCVATHRWHSCPYLSAMASGTTSASPGRRGTACGKLSRMERSLAPGRTWPPGTPSSQGGC